MKSLKPLHPDAFDYWKAQHLLNRAGFGGTPQQVQGLASLGLRAAVDYVIDYHAIDAELVRSRTFDPDIMHPLIAADRDALRQARRGGDEATLERFRARRQTAQQADRRQVRDIQRWWLTRMIETPRPLEEKMTLFWHGHFATSYRSIENSYHMFLQNQLFRSHAIGNFKSLTHAIIRDPAMLRYLNNDQNRKQSPNENLARELMELFTLGEGHGYSERDIKEGARALTGYTFRDDDFAPLGSRQYRRRHDEGRKQILGKTGAWDGDDFVDIIFARRACSEHLCWKLYRFFVHDLPGEPDTVQERFIVDMATRLRDSRYQLRPLLRTLFMSAHFYDDANIGSQIKSPVQLIVQAIRTLHLPPRQVSALASAAELMGQNVLFPPSVKGWDGGRSWINTSTLYVRQNTLVFLLTGRRPDRYPWQDDGSRFDATHLIDHLRRPDGSVMATDAVTYLLRINLAGPPHQQRIDELVTFVEERRGRMDNAMIVALLSLITSMPEYQLC